MKASEARKKAQEAKEDKPQIDLGEYRGVINAIAKAAASGAYEVQLKEVSKPVADRLSEDGYTVLRQRCIGCPVTISWISTSNA